MEQRLLSHDAWLVFNGGRAIKVNRDRVASSCHYLATLLKGSFKESKQLFIELHLSDSFSYEALECLIRYADQGLFVKDPEAHDMHIATIQLGIMWGFQEFVDIVESHLMEQVTLENLVDLLGLAYRHKPLLNRLLGACEEFELTLNEGFAKRNMPRCSFDDHEQHHYLCCYQDDGEEDWDQTISTVLTEDEKRDLARMREMRRLGFKY